MGMGLDAPVDFVVAGAGVGVGAGVVDVEFGLFARGFCDLRTWSMKPTSAIDPFEERLWRGPGPGPLLSC